MQANSSVRLNSSSDKHSVRLKFNNNIQRADLMSALFALIAFYLGICYILFIKYILKEEKVEETWILIHNHFFQ